MSKLGKKAKGAFSGLQEAEEINVVDNKDKKIKTKKEVKKDDEKKVKRTYMLTTEQLKALHLLKVEYPDKDLSEIVGVAIKEKLERDS